MTYVVGKPAPSSQRLEQLGQYVSSLWSQGLLLRRLTVCSPSGNYDRA